MTDGNGSGPAEQQVDPFFEQIADGQGNACTGPQGHELHLVEGYLQASSILADAATDGDVRAKDELIMPILYNVRHGLELSLKYAVRELATVGLLPQIEGPMNHNIQRYYDHLSDHQVPDLEARKLISALQPYVRSLAKIDGDGQQFRFFEDNTGKPTLEETPVINVPLVRDSIAAFTPLLKSFHETIDRLLNDHPIGSATSECSRQDLFDVAAIIGPSSSWAEPSFNVRKAEVKEKYSLSNGAFVRALDRIKGSRELGAKVGIESELKFLTGEKATRLVALCLEHSPPPAKGAESKVLSVADIRLELLQGSSPEDRIAEAVLQEFSREEIADAQAIFYLARNRSPGDLYERELEFAMKDHEGDQLHKQRTREVLGKLNFAEEFINGLCKVGQPLLSQKLAELRESERISA